MTEADLNRYVESIERSGGFRVPNFYYLNHLANDEYNRTNIKGEGVLQMPVLYFTAEYDQVCTPDLANIMPTSCSNLTLEHVYCGHWCQQERPTEVNGAIIKWIAQKLPADFWPKTGYKKSPFYRSLGNFTNLSQSAKL